MLAIGQHHTVEEASDDLLDFILEPRNWVALERLQEEPEARPGQNPHYQRRVGLLRICASVDVTPALEVFLRVAFRAPGLTPMRASDHLEAFLRKRVPFTANSEWQVEIDGRQWIHFFRRWTGTNLVA
jgi:hypothetical protein